MSDTFSKWLDTFVEEKGIDLEHDFYVKTEHNEHIVSVGSIVEQMKVATADEKSEIERIIVMIDFADGDVMHFLEHLAKPLAEAYDRAMGFTQNEKKKDIKR
jgi:hypothetical protein